MRKQIILAGKKIVKQILFRSCRLAVKRYVRSGKNFSNLLNSEHIINLGICKKQLLRKLGIKSFEVTGLEDYFYE